MIEGIHMFLVSFNCFCMCNYGVQFSRQEWTQNTIDGEDANINKPMSDPYLRKELDSGIEYRESHFLQTMKK